MSVIIGLTGGIGSGKSMVAKIFESLGIPVFNADAIAKEIMNTNAMIKSKLMEAFGNEVYSTTIDKNGIVTETLNRAYLSKLVFSDPFQLEILNAIVHPVTIQAAIDWAAAQSAPYVIKEAALFFESGSANGISKIIGVSAPKSLRIHRVLKRDQCTKEEVEKRMTHQIEETIKMKLCDFVIVNDDQHLVVPQVVALHEKLLAELK
jgi:dephospho-CoA kinase